MSVNFDQDEAKVIAFLVEHFDQRASHVRGGNIASATELPPAKIDVILERFDRYGMVSRAKRAEIFGASSRSY